MNYEDFSDDAKAAIALWRQVLPRLLKKNNVGWTKKAYDLDKVEAYLVFRPRNYSNTDYRFSAEGVGFVFSMTVKLIGLSSCKEALVLQDFAKSKNYWIPKTKIKDFDKK